jgi:hypothetical protein
MFRFWAKFGRLLAIVLLLLSVACSELPELATLSDNTSNDFTTQSYVAREVALAAVTLVPAEVPVLRRLPRTAFVDVPQRASSFCISRDLLLLYSTFRT